MGKSMDFGADGRAGLRTALGRRKSVAACRVLFFAMILSEESARRFED